MVKQQKLFIELNGIPTIEYKRSWLVWLVGWLGVSWLGSSRAFKR